MHSDTVELKATDGHELQAYRAQLNGSPKGGVVVLQEIFGVTNHIRRVTDQFAEAGYLAIAPALFDRIERGVDLDYTAVAEGREYRAAAKPDQTVLDIEAAVNALRQVGKIGVVGYCWGGGMA
jgi:carboxymethylenebutenolidase